MSKILIIFYRSFRLNKSKIGHAKVSPNKSMSRSPSKNNDILPGLDMVESTYSDVDRTKKFHYDPMN